MATALAAFKRFDAWLNVLTGLGTQRGRNATQFEQSRRTPLAEYEAMYHDDALARRVVDLVPHEAMRQGVEFRDAEGAPDEPLTQRWNELRLSSLVTEAWIWARALGGACIVIGANDGREMSQPLDLARPLKVQWLEVASARDLIPGAFEADPASARFGQPNEYRWQWTEGTVTHPMTVHASRCVRFDGPLTSPLERAKNAHWNDSELRRLIEAIAMFNGAFAATGSLVSDASQAVFKLKGLVEMMAADRQGLVDQRLQLVDQTRSVGRSVVIDAEEEFERKDSSALTGVADVMDRFMLLVCAHTGYPATLLFGRSPAGMNATGDADIRAFYDRIKAEQAATLEPRIRALVDVLLAEQSRRDDVVQITFPSLWQPTPMEIAQERAAYAQSDVAYVQAGVLAPEEVALSRFGGREWSREITIDTGAREMAQAADADVADGVALPSDAANVADTALNGAQVASLVDIVTRIAAGTLPRSSGVAIIARAFSMTSQEADALVGDAGRSFTIAAPDATAAATAEAPQGEAGA